VSPTDAAALLATYRWKERKLTDAWLANRAKTRKDAGLPPETKDDLEGKGSKKVLNPNEKVQCGTLYCVETERKLGTSLSCGHFFCDDCWRNHLTHQVETGPSAIFAKCLGVCDVPGHLHNAACKCLDLVPYEIFEKYLIPADFAKYSRYRDSLPRVPSHLIIITT
jgi:hypothetical protein